LYPNEKQVIDNFWFLSIFWFRKSIHYSSSPIIVSESESLCNWWPVSQSWHWVVWESWSDFGCSQDICGFVMGRPPWQEDRSAV